MTETYVTALAASDRSLLEALPCYVFVQRGGDVTYANRVAREMLGTDERGGPRGGRCFREVVFPAWLTGVPEALSNPA